MAQVVNLNKQLDLSKALNKSVLFNLSMTGRQGNAAVANSGMFVTRGSLVGDTSLSVACAIS